MMRSTRTNAWLIPLLLVTLTARSPGQDALDLLRQKAHHIMQDGNHKDAFEIYDRLSVDPDNDPLLVGQDLMNAAACLQRIHRGSETDDLRERAIAVHSRNWRLLYAAAQSYWAEQHYGYIVAGDFQRGQHRGGGRYVNSIERDRVRALQLMNDALALSAAEPKKSERAGFVLEFATMVLGHRGISEAWRLQYLSDLSELPDYEDGYRYHNGEAKGAPVDEEGAPVFHAVPESFEKAATDGERWRWLLNEAVRLDAVRRPGVLLQYADFLHQQFGVQTMAYYQPFFQRRALKEGDESGTYALHTLHERETIAKLATGIKRFNLPESANFIRIFRDIVDTSKGREAESSIDNMARVFENRRQYDRALAHWNEAIRRFGKGRDEWREKRVDQIVDCWGRFEPVMTHPAGEAATVEFIFRNGNKVHFEAYEILFPRLLEDVKDYIKSNPNQLDWEKLNIANIGYRLVQKDERKYVGQRVEAWDVDLKPRPMHFDSRITVKTPLRNAGAYLLRAHMQDGNVSSIIIWINDTVIARKQLDKQAYFFVADAVTGRPLPKVNLEFFGYRQIGTKWEKAIGRRYNVVTSAFELLTDPDGQLTPRPDDFNNDYQWLITATTSDGRLAYLGFSNVWHGNYHDREYNQTKAFMISDRPVYRPNQPVRFKFWVRHAQYDMDDRSQFADRPFFVRIEDAKNEKVYEEMLKSDAYGGVSGEYSLPGDAALGMWRVSIGEPLAKDAKTGNITRHRQYGGGTFRVEEYKKPEFEVTIDAPDEPVILGEAIKADIRARYYFGAPVTKARVKYKVLRSKHGDEWYPIAPWDWFYGPGYWWFAYDYAWYPGWHEWGCRRPHWWWWPSRPDPPEVVAEAEVPLGPEGTFTVTIDTALAKEMHGDSDHKYEITAEVTDESRRTIVGQGSVLVARRPFKVYAWVDRGHYRVGDVIGAEFSAHTVDRKPVQGRGELKLYRLSYTKGEPVETEVQSWQLDTDMEGRALQQIKASRAGQYRLSYTLTDAGKHRIEGGHVFCIMGEGFDGKAFRFNEIELVPDKREYRDGEKVRLMVNTDREESTVLLFIRPANGVYLPPEVIRLDGKSTLREITVTRKDMPNFFVEAVTVSGGRIYDDTREIVVPPEKRVLDVEVLPSAEEYKPGEKAEVKIKVTDVKGQPFVGTTVLTVYDKAVEYISGGSNVPDIREFFWKWRRHHRPHTESNLARQFANLVSPKELAMQSLGVFGHLIADQDVNGALSFGMREEKMAMKGMSMDRGAAMPGAPMALSAAAPMMEGEMAADAVAPQGAGGGGAPQAVAQPSVRTKFADTAFWAASLATDAEGIAEVTFDMPENLSGWKIKTWAMGHGTVVGEGLAEVVTTKNVLLRLQAPRFFVEKDEVVLSANVHNYLKAGKSVQAVLETEGGCLDIMGESKQTVTVEADGEHRIDWRVKVVREGEAVVRMKALTDEESDAMEMRFPVYVHGMLKTDSFCGVVRRTQDQATITMTVPSERRIEQSRLEVRYSPTLAGAMVDALPYLVSYPYGCTEQTLNRFLPSVIVQKILKDMEIDLAAVKAKRTNLNAQEIGDDVERARQWQRWEHNPVFDEEEVHDMVVTGLKRLTAMQLSDGGWGWFSGWREHSSAHTTAYVVHGLQTAQQNGVVLIPGVLERGIKWLRGYQDGEVRKLKNAPKEIKPWKSRADNLDAFVYMVLCDSKHDDADMREFLYRDRKDLSVYAKAMIGFAYHTQGHAAKRDMLLRNIEQFLVVDDENQSAYLNLQNGGYWWYWYGSEYEAHAYYLKLLAAVAPQSDHAAGLVKYLLNNRKHATHWNSTRDTALCVEALADYLRASAEDKPDMTVEILLDGVRKKEVRITAEDLFTFDNKLVLTGKSISAGEHELQIRRRGKGPVYFNAYLTNFTLEDFITRAGLEVKVERKYYRLVPEDKSIKVAGARGQALDQKLEKYRREELANFAILKSGDLVEIELMIESKNDYEYLVFEDMKPAGFEPVDVRSGYVGRDLPAYMELRDEKVAFFVRSLARGKHSVSYRMRAEMPGHFSALPTRAFAMYAPELKANSDEIKLRVED